MFASDPLNGEKNGNAVGRKCNTAVNAAKEINTKMKTANLLFPHQLFQQHELYENGFPIYFVEEHLFFKEFKFHKTKLAFHRASMKYHAKFLEEKRIAVHYIESINPLSDVRALIISLAEHGITTLNFIDPTDNWLQKRIASSAKKSSVKLNQFENPLFLNTLSDLSGFFDPTKKSFFQTAFYKQQRIQYGILVDNNNNPLGGQWSFDGDNRKKYPKGKLPPPIHFPESDEYWNEAIAYTEMNFSHNLGEVSRSPKYPYTKTSTEKWLEQFFAYRFHDFGDYEDAIVKNEAILNHSVFTPMLNIGLVSPTEIINGALNYGEKNAVPMNSLEGFVRQILGWREFIRGMYECKGTQSRNSNFWEFDRKIPKSFYNGTTGITPLDDTIQKVLRHGYCHHIERLMVLGNFMLLCEFHPNEVYRWFMELFIDAYDWVMVPNVYGMSQFADGGLFATKPYISGSNYILKMSDYPKGGWQRTWDGLFWRFLHIHRDFFAKNPRLSMLLATFDKMPVEKKNTHLEAADSFLLKLDNQ